MSNLIYGDNNVRFYKTDVRDFIPEITNATFQRKVDADHVKKLAEELKLSKHCVGTFKAVQFEDDNRVELIDGQHRVLALAEIMKNDATFNMNVFLEVYTSTDKKSQRDWFIRANNVKNFEEEDLPNVAVDELVDRLKMAFGNSIVNTEIVNKTKIYRPKVDSQALTQALKKHIDEHSITDADALFQRIIQLNNIAGMKGMKGFKNVSATMWKKAKDNGGFYLGLYENLVWVKDIGK